jgi:hypothetical protein
VEGWLLPAIPASAYSVPSEGWPCTVALRLPLGVWTAFPSQGCVPPSAVHVPLRSVLTAPPLLPPSGAPPLGGWPCTVALRLPLGVWTTFVSQGCVVSSTVHVPLSSSEWTAPPPLPPLAAKAGTVVATIIAAMTRATVTNKSMRLMISATSSREGGAEESRLRLYNATTLASGDESAMNLRRRTAVRLIHPTSGKGNSQKSLRASHAKQR